LKLTIVFIHLPENMPASQCWLIIMTIHLNNSMEAKKMKISKPFIFICTLVLLGAGMALLGAWDMQRAVAAPEPEAWLEAAPILQPTALAGFVQCPDDPDHFYVIGGGDNWGSATMLVLRYEISSDTWLSLAELPVYRIFTYSTCYQDRIYSFDTGFFIYDIATDTWVTGPQPPRLVTGAALGVWDGKLFVVGGSFDSWIPDPHVDIYDIVTGTWLTKGGADMPTATNFSGWVQAGSYLYISGGWLSETSDTDITQRYDMATDSWMMASAALPASMGVSGLVVNGQKLYNIGGSTDYVYAPLDQVLVMDLSVWPDGAWVPYYDFLPFANGGMSPFCTEGKTGGEIWSVAGGYADEFGNVHVFDTNLYHTTSEPCFDFYFGDLPRESMELGNHPGDAAHYVLPLINNGTLTDTFDIAASGVWTITVPITFGPLAPGGTGLLMVDVDVPPGANPGEFDTGVVTVTSQGDPNAWDSAVLTTSVTDWQEIHMPIADSFHNTVQCPDDPEVFYMIGGSFDNLVPIDDLWSFDASTGFWVKLADLPFADWGGVAGCYQGKLYIGGGSGTLYDFGSFDLTNNTWTWLQSTPRWFYGAATGVWDGKLYVAGGYLLYPFVPTDLVNIYDIASNTWSLGPSMPTAVMAGGYTQAGPYLYVVGGISGDWNNNLDTTLRLNMATESWEIGPVFTSRRSSNALAITESHLYAMGGDVNGGERMDPTGLVEVLDLSQWPGGAWTDLNQPLPWPLEGIASACTEAITGGEIWSVGGAYGSWHHPWYEYHAITDAYYLHTEPCVSYGVDLPDPWEGEGEIGHQVTYTLSITNTGVVTDYYTIEVTTTWGAGSPLGGPGGPVGPGESIQNLIVLNVPADVHMGDQGLTEIIATSYSNPTAVDNTLITTTVTGNDVHIYPDSLELSGFHGEVITYTLTVSNMGTITDTVSLTYAGNTWEVLLPVTNLDLGIGESATVVIYVTIPEGAWPGDSDDLTLTATSAGNPSANDSATLTTTAFWYRTLMPLSLKN
jgi:Kelch motif/Galactose oxidase, central domain